MAERNFETARFPTNPFGETTRAKTVLNVPYAQERPCGTPPGSGAQVQNFRGTVQVAFSAHHLWGLTALLCLISLCALVLDKFFFDLLYSESVFFYNPLVFATLFLSTHARGISNPLPYQLEKPREKDKEEQ